MTASRVARRQETVRRILDAAWRLSRERGLTGWTLRDLGAEVGMRAPSLYEYAASKNALFDQMFADGYRRLGERIDGLQRPADPVELARAGARLFVGFAAEEPARFQLLFQFTAPGFAPSAESMALARRPLDELAGVLVAAGVDPAELDLWTAVLTGLASQQVSNDPGGDRWLRLTDTALDRLLLPAHP
ncbi:MAG TPA: TetR/AcrR family transcriptional regulator [Mycobacteriales bacterium]|nr:TetR/AcrR family transcriptional regulator [Mycobacteriales bacterium]